MFDLINKRFTPKGWPAEVEIRELVADDVMPMFVNGKPDSMEAQRALVYLATWTPEGERVFESAAAVGKTPARMLTGLMEITREVMRLNMPTIDAEAVKVDSERPTSPQPGDASSG